MRMTTLTDIIGSDINISYEDGLRLSELMGQHDQLIYKLDHLLMSSSWGIVLAVFVAIIVYWLIFSTIRDEIRSDNKRNDSVYEDDTAFETFKPRGSILRKVEVRECTRNVPKSEYFNDPVTGMPSYRTIYVERKYKEARYEPRMWPYDLFSLVMVALIIVGITWGCVELNAYFINSDLANVNGQIDSILERYT